MKLLNCHEGTVIFYNAGTRSESKLIDIARIEFQNALEKSLTGLNNIDWIKNPIKIENQIEKESRCLNSDMFEITFVGDGYAVS